MAEGGRATQDVKAEFTCVNEHFERGFNAVDDRGMKHGPNKTAFDKPDTVHFRVTIGYL